MGIASLAVHGVGTPQPLGSVEDVARSPGQPRQDDQGQPPRRRSEECREEGTDDDRSVADVQQTVVVQLGRRQDCALRVGANAQLPGRQADRDHAGTDHDDHTQPPRGVPALGGREDDHVGDQTAGQHAEEQIAGEEPQELVPRVKRDLAALEDPSDEDEQARRQCPCEHRDHPEERPWVLLDSTRLQRKEKPLHLHHQLSMTRGDRLAPTD